MNKPNVPQNKDIRTNENADHLAGDVVVFIDTNKPGHLMTVHKVQGNGLLLDGNHNFALTHLVRSATVAEVMASRRLTPVEQSVAEVS